MNRAICSFVGIVLTLFALPTVAQNSLTAQVFATLKTERETGSKGRFTNFIEGAGTAYGWANAKLAGSGVPKMFCELDKLELNATNYVDIALKRYQSNSKLYDSLMGNYPLDALSKALLDGLVETFPCQK